MTTMCSQFSMFCSNKMYIYYIKYFILILDMFTYIKIFPYYSISCKNINTKLNFHVRRNDYGIMKNGKILLMFFLYDSFCWVKNTYYLPWNKRIPPRDDTENRQMVTYYQWIPFILLGQAIFFYLPTVIWHAFNSKGGIDADNILEAANELSRTEKAESREKTINMVTKQVDRFLESRKQQEKFQFDFKNLLSATLCRCCGRRYVILLLPRTKEELKSLVERSM